MSRKPTGTIQDDNSRLKALAQTLSAANNMPPGTDARRLSQELKELPSLPDRFNAAFISSGWVFVEFACGHEAAEAALRLHADGASQDKIDEFLAERLLNIEPIKWQTLKLLGGGIAEPRYPVRSGVVERMFEAYLASDFLVAVPLGLMLIDGFGVTLTGSKSIFGELDELSGFFQSMESVSGHPSALRALLLVLTKGCKGYNEASVTMPFRNGILHGVRLNYASVVVAAKMLNLLAAVVEFARDIAPESKGEAARRLWNARFLEANLSRLKPSSPERALELFQAALAEGRVSDLVALVDYDPIITLLSEKRDDWVELAPLGIRIEPISPWEIFGSPQDSEQQARCHIRLVIRRDDCSESREELTLYATRSARLAAAGLPSVWQIGLNILGSIRSSLSVVCAAAGASNSSTFTHP
jgi:hypothetical protein